MFSHSLQPIQSSDYGCRYICTPTPSELEIRDGGRVVAEKHSPEISKALQTAKMDLWDLYQGASFVGNNYVLYFKNPLTKEQEDQVDAIMAKYTKHKEIMDIECQKCGMIYDQGTLCPRC